MSETGTGMDVLRTVVSASSAEDPAEGDNSREPEYAKSIRLTAKLPTILATYIRRRRGEQPVPPDQTLTHAANFARMAGLDEAHPKSAEILNTCFILQAEHGLNASTFAARITAATLADMHAAVTAALGALKGPLHGGATDGTMKMLDEIGGVDRVAAFVERGFATKYKLPGFGHRVYVTTDPRAKFLRAFAQELSKAASAKNMPPYFEIQERLVEEVNKRRQFPVNVDYYAATTYTYLGIPADLGTSIFAIGRMAGWCAHIMEQHGEDRKSTRLNSSHGYISYAAFCLKKKKPTLTFTTTAISCWLGFTSRWTRPAAVGKEAPSCQSSALLPPPPNPKLVLRSTTSAHRN